MHGAAAYHKYTAVGAHREIDRQVESATPKVGAEPNGIDVVHFCLRACFGSHGLHKLVFAGGDYQLQYRDNQMVFVVFFTRIRFATRRAV